MNALAEAMANKDRMHGLALKAVSDVGSMVNGPAGIGKADLSKHRDQYQHNRGWAYVAVRAIAQRVARQRVFVGLPSPAATSAKATGDELQPMDSHPLLDAIAEPNPILTQWALMVTTISSLELTGKCYWWIREGDSGRMEIWPLPTHWVEADHAQGLYGRWKVRPDGKPEGFTLDGAEVAYFCLPDPADPMGSISPLQSQAPAIIADEQIQSSQAAAFADGIMPKLILKAGTSPTNDGKPGPRVLLSGSQRRQLINTIKQVYAGVRNHHEPFILDAVIESIEKISNKPAEMDYQASGKQVRSRIMAAFGVNPIIVGEIDGVHRAQATVAEQMFAENVINPLLTLLGEVMSRRVAPLFDDRKLVVWIEPAVANDAELKIRAWDIGLARGAVSGNEYRTHILNLPTRPRFERSAVDVITPLRLMDGWQSDVQMAHEIGAAAEQAAGALIGDRFASNGHV